mgnify:CR=1 FL=1
MQNNCAGKKCYSSWLTPLVLALVLAAARSHSAPLFATDTPDGFFTNVASRLVFCELGLNLTHLHIYPTNQYTPPVQRLVQVTANIYDATTTNFYPSVFRPVFSTDATGTNIFISGYEQVVSVSGINDPQLAPPVDVSALVLSGTSFTNSAVNIYGVPWIIGAKKGLPGLNQFSLVSAAQFTRKLQVARNFIGGPIWTNQMVVMSITNNLGISFWNSYATDYPTNYGGGLNMSIVVHSEAQSVVTNSDWATTAFLPRSTANYVFHPTRWPGSKWAAYGGGTPDPTSFFAWQWTNTVVPAAVYNFTTKTFNVFANATNFWDTNRTILDPLPQFGLLTTNWVQAYILDNTNVIDYVQLRGPIDNANLNSALKDPNFKDATGQNYLWSTNVNGGGTPYGIVNQIDISSQNITTPPSARWKDPGVKIPGIADSLRASRIFFSAFLMPNSIYQYQTDFGALATYTNFELSVQAPYSAVRTVYVPYLYQVNDPLVHYLASDLDVGKAGVWLGNNVKANGVWGQIDDPTTLPFPTPPTTEIVKGRYQPWGKSAPFWLQSASYNFDNPYNLTYKDPLVWGSDYWDFPTGQSWNLNWLGRVHRGTPWQTIYLKAHNVLHTFYNNTKTVDSGTNTWEAWTGDYNSQDAQQTGPLADRQLVSLLAAMLNTNDLHAQFSVNSPDPNAWAGLLDGFTVLTNSANMPSFNISTIFPTKFDPLMVSSNSSQVSVIVEDIQSLRTGPPFHQIGDILAALTLTEQSPFLNRNNVNQINCGISDEAYEAIPSQLLPLLWIDSIGAMISTNGQMQVQFSGYDGYDYVIQVSSDLIHWINLSTNTPINGTFYFTVPVQSNLPQQFYRSLLKNSR